MAYRVEISATKQAGCQATHCKNDKVKIQKGEIRQGVLVDTGEFTSLKWRHWGCVTPYVLHNWWEAAEHDFELIDGLDVMPADAQEKVKRALEQGHVDDDDWNGDLECNRLGKKNQGMFLKGNKKADEDEGEEKKPTGKKRGRPAKTEAADDDEAEKPASKKGKKAAATSTEDPTPKKGRGRPKKAATVADAEDDAGDDAGDDAEVEVAPKKARGRPRKSIPAEEKVEEVEEPEAPSVKKARGRPRNSVSTDVEDEAEEVEAPSAKKARGRPRKSVATDAEDEVEAPVKKSRGRPKSVKPSEGADEPAPKKGRGRPRKSIAADEE